MESFLPLIELILPEFIIENYLLTHVEKSVEHYHVYLEEINYSEDDPRKADLLSKGYFPTITLQDFPIRGYKVFLHIKRRRWLNTKTGKVEYRDWNEVADGTRMTSEFSRYAAAGFFKSDWWIQGPMMFGVSVVSMALMAGHCCANSDRRSDRDFFRADLRNGNKEVMQRSGFYTQKI